jgi:hypothetical protein
MPRGARHCVAAESSGRWPTVAASAQQLGKHRQEREQGAEQHHCPVDIEAGEHQEQAQCDQPEPAGQSTDSTAEGEKIRSRLRGAKPGPGRRQGKSGGAISSLRQFLYYTLCPVMASPKRMIFCADLLAPQSLTSSTVACPDRRRRICAQDTPMVSTTDTPVSTIQVMVAAELVLTTS